MPFACSRAELSKSIEGDFSFPLFDLIFLIGDEYKLRTDSIMNINSLFSTSDGCPLKVSSRISLYAAKLSAIADLNVYSSIRLLARPNSRATKSIKKIIGDVRAILNGNAQ